MSVMKCSGIIITILLLEEKAASGNLMFLYHKEEAFYFPAAVSGNVFYLRVWIRLDLERCWGLVSCVDA